ncbi:MAG: isoprenyl transferase [Anaerolineae bacterium]|jgi:undecaprenyl diphosphate synthase|nr:isoprenyl transferase [Anaerolineae bacterium]
MTESTPVFEIIPAHVAIIMDGNGRWAAARGLPRLAGHRAGTENLRRIIDASIEFGIRHLTLYAFSTENWGRPREEVDGLLSILQEVIDREVKDLHENGVRLRHIGHLEHLSPGLRTKVNEAIELTKNNDRLSLNLAFSYGGRDEIVCAVRQMIEDGIEIEQVDESLVNNYLFTKDIPDPDLIIRTSGEMRISNFLIWQSAYSEWYITPTFWPDFDRQQLIIALQEYARRDRRYGRISPSPCDPDGGDAG